MQCLQHAAQFGGGLDKAEKHQSRRGELGWLPSKLEALSSNPSI
jgi:hypothetical protein